MSRRLSPCHALACAVLCTLAVASPATAATQTEVDPTEAYPADFGRTTDLRAVTLDTTSQAGSLLITAELEFDAQRTLAGVVYLDTDSDFKADYAIEIPYNESRHPKADGTGGAVGYHLRTAEASTTDCQSYDDTGGIVPPIASGSVPATRRTADDRTLFTIPLDLASIGSPASFRWALITQSSFFEDGGPTFYYDLLPDAANGLPLLDPRNPPPGEQDPWFCFPPVAMGQAFGYHVDLSHSHVFGTVAPPVNQPPTVTLVQATVPALPQTPAGLVAQASDSDGTIQSYAWDLDQDGAFDDADRAAIVHTFPTAGPHRVGVRVIDNGGLSAFASLVVDVQRRAPRLTVTVSKLTPVAGEQITATASIFSDAPYDPAEIEWGFDTNNNGDDLEPYSLGRGATLPLTFARLGVYTLKARIRNAAGEVALGRLRINLLNKPPTLHSFRIRAKRTPDNPFNTDPLVYRNPIILEAIVDDDSPTRPRVDWDLDDDAAFDDASGEKLEHVFATAGTKRIAVRITDDAGLTAFGNTAFEVLETASSACGGKAGGDGIRATGCFRPDRANPTTMTSQAPIKVNGLDLVPKSGATINVGAGGVLFTSGNGVVEIKAGSVTLFEGRFAMDANCKPAEEECLLGSFKAPVFARLKGFPLKSDVEVFLTPEGTLVKVDVDVFSELGGFAGEAELLTTDTGGLQLNSLDITTPEFKIGEVEIGQFSLSYEGEKRRWAGGGEITLPTPTAIGLAGDFAFSEITGFERFHGEVDNINVPLDEGTVYLQRIAATLEVKGFEQDGSPRVRLGGGLGISAGPSVAGVKIATVDGDFLFTFGDPLGIDVEGRIGIGGYDIMGGTAGVRTNGHAEMEGKIKFGLPFPGSFRGKRQDATKAKVSKDTSNGADDPPPNGIVDILGEASAWAEPQAFDLEASISLRVIGITLARAAGLISNIGIAGCGEIVGIRGGFGYNWDTQKVDVFALSCDMANYRPVAQFPFLDTNGAGREPEEDEEDDGFAARRPADRRQAAWPAGSREARRPAGTRQSSGATRPPATAIDVPAGQRAVVLKLAGSGGDPLVTLFAPDGTKYAMSASSPVKQNDDFFAAQHPQENATIVGVRAPQAGRWEIVPQLHSAPIASVAGAQILPKPQVKATVRGTGRERTLGYDVKPIDGQEVAFVEQGSDTHRTIGTARARRGSIAFSPQDGAGRARKIVAIVKQNGLVRERLTVARYTAPPLRRAARPRGLRARRGADGNVTATWRPVPGARRYELIARVDDGRRLLDMTRAPRGKVLRVGRAHSLKLEVRALDPPLRASRPATLRLRAPLGPTIAPDPSGRTTSVPASGSLLLRCAGTGAVIKDVYRDRDRVRVVGAAGRRSAGKVVAIRLLAADRRVGRTTVLAGGKVVGRTKVLADGSFAASVALPARGLRGSDATRYRAEIAGAKPSPALKLARRVRWRSIQRTKTITTIKGHVVRPLARPERRVALVRQTGCGNAKVVARATPDRNGDFRFVVKTPKGVKGAAYRLRTSVRRPGSTREFTAHSVAHDMTLP